MATITSPRPQSPASANRNAVQSPTLTLSSSVRPSFDLPVNTNGRASPPAPGATGVSAQRRNRAALRDYYNLKSKPSPAQPPPGPLSRTASTASVESESTITSTAEPKSSASTSLPPQIDDPDFDAEVYVQKLLQTSTLRDLLKIEGGLVSEIKQLDGERKALVYDNYSKLIVATRTIGRMQRTLNSDADDGGGMKSMERLRPAVEGIEKAAGELGGGVAKGHGGRGERAIRRREREKKELVRWVVEAPGRFEGLLQEGRDDEVKEQWQDVQGLLQKWKGVKGVDEVRQACEKIVSSIEHTDEGEEEEAD